MKDSAYDLRTCVSPDGRFRWGLHRPHFNTRNLRQSRPLESLGQDPQGNPVGNQANFPMGDIEVPHADPIFEIPNAFPFRGTTYIAKSWADRVAADPQRLVIPPPEPCSLADSLQSLPNARDLADSELQTFYARLPEALRLTLATRSTDPRELVHLARLSCEFGTPAPQNGLRFKADKNKPPIPVIHDPPVFEALVNNPCLPDDYKQAMVLRPGIQGDSPITGEAGGTDGPTHVWEYMRGNSYIPWGHYAANMADDAVRYSLAQLTLDDMLAMRHLYYQRTLVRVAQECNLAADPDQGPAFSEQALETLRNRLRDHLSGLPADRRLPFDSHLWGWNFGFDYAPSHFRLHASHQQIHQQYAMIPGTVAGVGPNSMGREIPAYACGDLISDFVAQYRQAFGVSFFEAYLCALASNQRTDGASDKPRRLIVFEDDHIVLFVPKAQTSQYELQIMTRGPVGNLLEADSAVRRALDRALFRAVKALNNLGVRMISTIEFAKRLSQPDSDQRLLYSLLPKIPWSMGAFSEAQLRWIMGHYPEDFAALVRAHLPALRD